MILSGLKKHLKSKKIFKEPIEIVISNILLKLMSNILKKLHEAYNDLLFLSERMKIGKIENLVANLNDKRNMLFT